MPREEPAKVSVIVPCYNLGAYLDEAIDSVFAQTFQDFEIVIVNDGSTDPDTNRLLADYRRPRTRVVQSEHRGLAAARNLAIQHARGRYLCALDADDKLAPTFLERTTRRLDGEEGLTFVSCWLKTFGAEDWVWKQDRCDLPTLLGECTVATPALVRAAAVRAAGGYDTCMPVQGYEDWDLWITLVERGGRGAIIPEVLFHYRRRPGSMSETCCRGEAHLSLMRYLVSKHEASYREHLLDVLIHQEAASCELLKETYALDREIDGQLVPRIERRREELQRLQRRLQDAEQREWAEARRAELEREVAEARRDAEFVRSALAHAQAEVAALRQSRSWRLTSPLRAGYDLLQRLRGPAGVAPVSDCPR
jgi:glycosyltransferase involved in cell wall biosynthesis